MANTNVPMGLSPLRHRNGAPYSGGMNKYFVPSTDATALYLGDPVIFAGAADPNGVATVTKATAGASNYMLGPVVAVEGLEFNDEIYRPASTARYVWVADDPDLVFEIQEDAVGGALPLTAVGQNANWVDGAGNAFTGLSAVQLDSSTAATTNTLQLKILGFSQKVGNEPGVANAKVEVMINLHALRNLTGV